MSPLLELNVMDLGLAVEYEFDYEHYYEKERTILTPAIKKAGYELVGEWYTLEGDSFGPLTRAIKARTQDGELVRFWYG